MPNPDRRQTVDTGAVELSVLEWGQPEAPPLVIIHGISDQAIGMHRLAAALAERWRVVVADLRGHGDSGKPNAYGIADFAADLGALIELLELEQPVLLGHSLGGQIMNFFMGLNPEIASALINVEGIGPPPRAGEGQPIAERMHAERAFATASAQRRRPRALPSLDFAIERLQANNRRLTPADARILAEHGTHRVGGELHWKFDPGAHAVWSTVHRSVTDAVWNAICGPMLLVLGDESHEYWTGRTQLHIDGWTGIWTDADLAERTACLPEPRIERMAEAGHMVHYDQPERLAQLVREFLEELG